MYDDVYVNLLSGYTVSSVIVGDWRRLNVAGAPRFKHKGKVILFELSNEGDVNIVQALNGEQVKFSYLVSLHSFQSLFFVHLYFSRKQQECHLSEIKTRTPPTGSKLK